MKKNFGKQTVLYPMPVFIIATYDENGNMTSWKFVENIGVDPYLSLDFSYKLVDGAPVTPTAANSIIPFYNWERMMSFIL